MVSLQSHGVVLAAAASHKKKSTSNVRDLELGKGCF